MDWPDRSMRLAFSSVLSFTLTDTEMETLDALDENLVTAWDPTSTP
jgi:hypothetical protein